MAGRRYGTSEVVYDDRRERDHGTRNGSRYDDRYEDVEIRRSRIPPVQEREVVREPAYLREDYGRTSSGPVVLRAREREEFEFSSRPRRRSPSPERKVERESIIIRRDESERPPPRRERSREREEIIIRRDERSRSRPPPPPPPQEREREEIIIKRSEDDRRSRIEIDDTKSRRSYRPPPPPQDYEREEIIIRREEEERRPPPRDIDYALIRPKSRERERSRSRRYSDPGSDDEIIITRENRSGRRGERDEIIIRHHSASRSPSPSPAPSIAPSMKSALPPPEPQVVNAPQIHQEVITHHRHIDHGYEVIAPPRPRPISRPPSPPSPPPPPPPRERSEERIEIRRRGERNGREYEEDIIIDRNEGARSAPPRDYYESPPPRRAPPMPAQQVMIRPPSPEPEPRAELASRYGRTRDPTAGLWTEVTKDLVVKEAIVQMGYEFEESEEFYYIISYLRYDDVARLVGLSEDIRKDRRRRMKEMEWESRVLPEEEPRPRLAIEPGPPPRRESPWEREDERYIEREIIYRGGRPPPPVAWRR